MMTEEFPEICQWFENSHRPQQVAVEVEIRSEVEMNNFSVDIPEVSVISAQIAEGYSFTDANSPTMEQTEAALTNECTRLTYNYAASPADVEAPLLQIPSPAAVEILGSDTFYSVDGGLLSIAETLNILHQLDQRNYEDVPELEQLKQENLCQMSEFMACRSGDLCKFVRLMLDLDSLPRNVVPKSVRILIIKQTPKGQVRTLENVTLDELNILQQLNPRDQVIYIQKIKEQRRLEQQEMTSVRGINEPLKVQLSSRTSVCNLPTPSPSPPSVPSPPSQPRIINYQPVTSHDYTSSGIIDQLCPSNNSPAVYTAGNSFNSSSVTGSGHKNLAGSSGEPTQCKDCSAMFKDPKQLLKHRRNHHQIYTCKECGEQATGYYKMAAHSKKVHSKEPLFFCECGRNFGEKKGMTKHQNSCLLVNKIQ